MDEQLVSPHVVALNEFLAASDWDQARRLLRSESLVIRWAAWRSLVGAAEAHEGGDQTARDRYLSFALAIICALDTAGDLDTGLRDEVAAFWSWCAGRSGPEPSLRAGPWRSAATVCRSGARVALSTLSECTDFAQAADVIDQESSLWTLPAVGAAAIDGYHAARTGESAAGDRLRFAAMLLERVGLPERLDSVKVSPVYVPLPRSLVEPLIRALARAPSRVRRRSSQRCGTSPRRSPLPKPSY